MQWVNDLACLCGSTGSFSGLVQWVKDPALLQLWCRSQMWLRTYPCVGISICCGYGKNKQTNKQKKKTSSTQVKIVILFHFFKFCIDPCNIEHVT